MIVVKNEIMRALASAVIRVVVSNASTRALASSCSNDDGSS